MHSCKITARNYENWDLHVLTTVSCLAAKQVHASGLETLSRWWTSTSSLA